MKKKLTLLEQIFEQDCPEFANYRAVLGKGDRINQGRTDVSEYVARLANEKAKASRAYYEDNSLSNFKAYVTAATAHDNAESASNDLSNMNLSWRHSDDDIETLLAALRVVQSRLRTRICALNDEERQRLESAGVDPGGAEHPAITNLKAHLERIADAILYCERFIDNPAASTFQWQRCAQLIKLP